MGYVIYKEYVISDDKKVESVVTGIKSLSDSGILDELNSLCKAEGCEIDWSFSICFPKVFMLRYKGDKVNKIWKKSLKRD